jgi:glycosyltransferase involved in cell wall biosynthesis
MKISIVTPSYNQAEYLERTILSVWSQEGDFDLEHIIIDGGSTDESLAIIKKYDLLYTNGQYPFKCKNFKFMWVSENDKGQSDALNKGFSMSTGEILGWLNSDDMFCSYQSLQIVFKAFLEHDTADILLGNTYIIDGHDNVIKTPVITNNINNDDFQKILKDIMKFDIIMQPSSFFKRYVWASIGISDNSYIMDWVLWIDSYKNNCKFFKINHYIASYRQQDNAKTVFATKDRDANIKRCEEIIAMYKKYDTWCLNRFYYAFYLLLLRASKHSFTGRLFDALIPFARRIRNILALRYKLY